MENANLIEKKYEKLYGRLRDLVADNEILPDINVKKFVSSKEDWMGVSKYANSINDIKKTPHITICYRDEKLRLALSCNGTQIVEKFRDLIQSYSERELTEFNSTLENLSVDYTFRLLYDDCMVGVDAPNYKIWNNHSCKNMTAESFKILLQDIDKMLLHRKEKQEHLPKGFVATVRINIEGENIDPINERDIKENILKLGNILKILHKIKHGKELKNKISREEHENTLKKLREQGIKI